MTQPAPNDTPASAIHAQPRYVCDECHAHVIKPLTAPHPFFDEWTIMGCPACREARSLRLVCDEPDCWKPVSCGTPTATGYRHTCGKHMPRP